MTSPKSAPRPPRTSPYWLTEDSISQLKEFLKDDRFDQAPVTGVRTEVAVAKHRRDLSELNLQAFGRALGYQKKTLPLYLYEHEYEFLLNQPDLPEDVRKDLEP